MIANDVVHAKRSFWLAWIIANALAIGFAWPLGEVLGRQAAESFGWRFGVLTAAIIFEGLLWTVRGAVLARLESYKLLQPIEIIIWVTAEMFGWVISERPADPGNSILGITTGVILSTTIGQILWIVIWFMKIPKPYSRMWFGQVFLWTFFGLIGGSLIASLILGTSLEMGAKITEMYDPIVGMAAAGVTLGGFIGFITGFTFTKLIDWQSTQI